MGKLGLENRLWEETLLEEWPSLVGPQVSRHARPGRLERGTLYIYVTHSMWLSELHRNFQPQILDNLQARFKEQPIRKLRFQLDPDLGRPSRGR